VGLELLPILTARAVAQAHKPCQTASSTLRRRARERVAIALGGKGEGPSGGGATPHRWKQRVEHRKN
jgi:hypothetical protein